MVPHREPLTIIGIGCRSVRRSTPVCKAPLPARRSQQISPRRFQPEIQSAPPLSAAPGKRRYRQSAQRPERSGCSDRFGWRRPDDDRRLPPLGAGRSEPLQPVSGRSVGGRDRHGHRGAIAAGDPACMETASNNAITVSLRSGQAGQLPFRVPTAQHRSRCRGVQQLVIGCNAAWTGTRASRAA